MVEIHQHSSCSEASQTYVFKVHKINCCEDCPKKLEKALQQTLHGIASAKVDARKSLATVNGPIDPKAVIDKIKKWGKKAELVPDQREDTNPYGYPVESNDRDEGEKEDLFNALFRHQHSSFRHEADSSSHQKDSSPRHKNFFSRICRKIRGKKNDYSESNAEEFQPHICRDIYCKLHKRDKNTTSDPVPKVNNGNNNPMMMNPYVQRPPMHAPPPLCYQGQYYGPRMIPPMAAYGSHAMQGQMPRPMLNGFNNHSTVYGNGYNLQ